MFHNVENPEVAIALAKEMHDTLQTFYPSTGEDKIIYSMAIEKLYDQMNRAGALDCMYIDEIVLMALLRKYANNDMMHYMETAKLTDWLEMIEIRCENLISIYSKYPLLDETN